MKKWGIVFLLSTILTFHTTVNEQVVEEGYSIQDIWLIGIGKG